MQQDPQYHYSTTVFTPTFNRAQLLPRLYESLKRQSCSDFEWLIVDDGSDDGTDEMVEKWRREAAFPIRYLWQENGGPHVAFNRGVEAARGRFFAPVGSDDWLLPAALERLQHHWDGIDPAKRSGYCGVAVLCSDREGNCIGNPFPLQVMDLTILEMTTLHGMTGDKWGFVLTDILKRYPFPEIPGEKFITESIVWNRLSLRYRMRFVNESLRVVEYHPDGLSSRGNLRVANPRGARLYYQEFLTLPVPLRWKLRNLVNYIRYSLHVPTGLMELIRGGSHWLPTALLLPAGYYFYRRDRSARSSNEPSE